MALTFFLCITITILFQNSNCFATAAVSLLPEKYMFLRFQLRHCIIPKLQTRKIRS